MNLPSRKKLGIATLIVAGLIAVAVPLMFLHGTSPQGASPNPTTTPGNGNSGSKASSGSGGGTGGNNGGSSGGTSDSGGGGGGKGTCSETKTHGPSNDSDPATKSHDDNGNAYGLIKNRLGTTVALVKSMGTHDSAFHLHHDTDTDNDAVHAHHNTLHDPTDHDSSCASGEEDHEQD